MSTTRISRARTRLALGSGVVVAMLISMTGVASAAGGSTAVAQATSAAPSAGSSAADPNGQTGADASEFEGYVGYRGANGQPAGAGAAADDTSVTKTEKLGPVGTNPDTNADVAGQPAANSQSDKGTAKLVLPTKPDKNSVAKVRSALTSASKARVIVLMKSDLSVSGGLSADALADQRADASAAHAELSATLAGTGSAKLSEYPLLPAAVYNVTSAGLDALLADPAVASRLAGRAGRRRARLQHRRHPVDPAEHAGVRGNNFDGSTGGAFQVAIIDSGVDNQHNAFTGRIVSQACFVTDFSCAGGTNATTAAGSGDECTFSSDCDHGTHVGSIAAGGLFTGGHEGVAPGAGHRRDQGRAVQPG